MLNIIKYKKSRDNCYKLVTNKGEYKLYSDIIIKYELLLKKSITDQEFSNILKENEQHRAYSEALKALNIKLRTERELNTLLKQKGFNKEAIEYAITRLSKDGYLNHERYIDAYIHDCLMIKGLGENKIRSNLEALGFNTEEINAGLSKVDYNLYIANIKKYVDKKVKANKKSAKEFKRKTREELINKGYLKEDINSYMDTLDIQDNEEEIMKLVGKLYDKYIKKYDEYTTKIKIKNHLYQKGYTHVDDYIEKFKGDI